MPYTVLFGTYSHGFQAIPSVVIETALYMETYVYCHTAITSSRYCMCLLSILGVFYLGISAIYTN